jgi:NAD-dependent SIR2 family protein deacetylase
MRVVLFLGAGFSKSAGFPLMREFSMFSQDLEGYQEHILCLHNCIRYAQRTRAFIHGDIYNVEYLMSVLSLAAITNPDLEFNFKGKKIKVNKALNILKQLVWRVYSRIEDISNLGNNYSLFVNSLKYFIENTNNSIDIITTNYDLLPEMMMSAIEHKATMPVVFERMDLPEGYNAPPGCASISGMGGEKIYQESDCKNLHKLHGSVNWFVKQNSKYQKVYCWDETFPPSRGISRLFYTPYSVCPDAKIPADYLPVIVPPSMIKEYKVPVILKAWQDASDAISKANKIIFIGYSFPPSDTIMKFFLGTSLTNNQSGCRITIIDKNTDAVKASLEEVFVKDIHKYHINLITSEFRELIGGRYFKNDRSFAEYLNS